MRAFFWVVAPLAAASVQVKCDPCIDRESTHIKIVTHGTAFSGFWQQVQRASVTAAELMHVTLTFDLWNRFDINEMAKEIKNTAALPPEERPDAMVVTVAGAEVTDAITEAAGKMPVFSVNAGYDVAESLGCLAHIGMHDENGGVFAGPNLEDAATKKGLTLSRCIAVNHERGTSSLTQREDGFKSYCDSKGLPMEIWDVNGANVYSMETSFTSYWQGVDLSAETGIAVLLLGEASIKPFRRILKQTAGAEAKTVFGVFDAGTDVFDALADGDLSFSIDQNQWLQGFYAVIVPAIYASTGQLMAPKVYMTGPGFIYDAPTEETMKCAAEAFPVCNCPWAGVGGEEAVPTSSCEAYGSTPGEADAACFVNGAPCTDARQFKIVGVTHGTLTDAFWYVVKAGAEQAALDFRLVGFEMELWDQFSPGAMNDKILEAAADPTVDGIFASIPSTSVYSAITEAAKTKKVVTINSGSDVAESLDPGTRNIVAHVGQDEFTAGVLGCEQLKRAGCTKILAADHEYGNAGLEARGKGCEKYMAEQGLTAAWTEMTQVANVGLMQSWFETELATGNWDCVLTLGQAGATPALRAVEALGKDYKVGSFDLTTELLEQIDQGTVQFGMDQQQYMQGYMAVVSLVVNLISGQRLASTVVESGPFFVKAQDPLKDACLAKSWASTSPLVCPSGVCNESPIVGARNLPAQDTATVGFPVCEHKPPIDCEPGEFLNPENECDKCAAGTYNLVGKQIRECFPCAPGSAQPAPGSTKCNDCEPGTFQALPGQEKCDPAQKGYLVPKGGAAEQQECPAGFYCPAGSSAAVRCPIGQYATGLAGTCEECVTSFTTLAMGSTSVQACVCEEGKYWSRANDECKACPIGDMFCPGGLDVPVVFEHFYGRLMTKGGTQVTTTKEALEAQKQAKLDGSFERTDEMFSEIEVFQCTEKMCSGTSMSWPMEQFGGLAVTADDVIDVDLGGFTSCPETRVGIGCGKCEEGWYEGGGGVACAKCKGGQDGANVVFLLFTPIILTVGYKVTSADGSARATQSFVLVSTAGLFSFFLQTIGVLDSFSVPWPDSMQWLFDLAKILMFDFNGISAGCAIGQEYGGRYWARIMFPIYIAAGVFIPFGLVKVLPTAFKMEFIKCLSYIGMIYSSLFITLCKVVVSYFECQAAPYTPRTGDAVETLALYRFVECGSDDHTSAVGGMVIGLLLYVIGFQAAVFWCSFMAPKYWMEIWFREAFKFTLSRWQPDTWYWGSIMVFRNFLMAISVLVSPEPRVQLMYMVCFMVVYIVFTATYQPWVQPILVHFDVLTVVILCICGIFGLVFLGLQQQIMLLDRYADVGAADSLMNLRDDMGVALVFCNGAFMASFGALMLWCLRYALPSGQQAALDNKKAAVSRITESAEKVCGDSSFIAKLKTFAATGTQYELRGAENLFRKLNKGQDEFGGGRSETTTFAAAKGDAKPSTGSAAPTTVSA